MASAYDEIKKVLVMLRQGEPITEQSRVELNRVRRLLEQELAIAEMTTHDLSANILEARPTLPNDSLVRKAAES